jgi:predicted nuclease of predicted toxin-antitoxin system
MKRCLFKVDENLPDEAAALLREAGHDAMSVVEQALSGTSDPLIAQVCRTESRALITLDRGFADIRSYPPADAPGIVVLRLARQDKAHVLSVLRRLLPVFVQEPLPGQLWIVEEDRIRIRE